MYVSELKLKNVRQFEERSFTFQPGFNLLVGENGAGKTTLLRAIYASLAKSSYAFGEAVFSTEDIRLHQHELEISTSIADANGKTTGNFTYNRTLQERTRRSSWQKNPLIIWYHANEATCSNLKGHRIYKHNFNELDKRIREEEKWLHLYQEKPIYNSDNKAKKAIFGSSDKIVSLVSQILSKFSPQFKSFTWDFVPYGCSLRPKDSNNNEKVFSQKEKRLVESIILRFFQETQNPFQKTDSDTVLVDSRGKVIGLDEEKSVMPAFDTLCFKYNIKIPLQTLYAYHAEIRLTPRILIGYNKMDVLYLHQLSDGEQRLFSIFIDIARQLSVAQQQSAIVLIDEIDVHLHPKWQRMIVPALEDLFPTCQFIATTHSPFIVQTMREHLVQRLDQSITGSYSDRGIEEIAAKVMDIKDPDVSPRYLEMVRAAKDYLIAIRNTNMANESTISDLRKELDSLVGRYAWNPAYQAFLELQRDSTLGTQEES